MIGKVNQITLGVVGVIVAFIVVFYIVGGTASTLTTSATNISSSGLPLASLSKYMLNHNLKLLALVE